MGWCSATGIFDAVAAELLSDTELDKRALLRKLINTLEDMDWDCQAESVYWNHPMVRSIFKELDPELFEDEDEDG